MTNIQNTPTQLYRHFDTKGLLLYVGISLRAIHRQHEHAKSKDWFAKIANITIEEFPDRDSAIEAEKKAIIHERPLYNVVHNGPGRDALIAKEKRLAAQAAQRERARHEADIQAQVEVARIVYAELIIEVDRKREKYLKYAIEYGLALNPNMKRMDPETPDHTEALRLLPEAMLRPELATPQGRAEILASLEHEKSRIREANRKASRAFHEAQIQAFRNERCISMQRITTQNAATRNHEPIGLIPLLVGALRARFTAPGQRA